MFEGVVLVLLFVDWSVVYALCVDDGFVCDVWMAACCRCGDWVGIVFGDCVCVGVVYVVVELVSMVCYVVVA